MNYDEFTKITSVDPKDKNASPAARLHQRPSTFGGNDINFGNKTIQLKKEIDALSVVELVELIADLNVVARDSITEAYEKGKADRSAEIRKLLE